MDLINSIQIIFICDSKGIVTIKQNNGNSTVGKIKISNVVGNNSMISVGDNLFMPKPGATGFRKVQIIL